MTPSTNPAADSYEWDVFIAHAGADTSVAETLFGLMEGKVRVFLDSKCLELGQEWDRELPKAQRASRVTVVISSGATDAAYYQRTEIAAAINLARRDESRHRVVPLFLDREASLDDTHYGLALKHGLVLSSELTLGDAARRLVELVGTLRAREAQASPAIADFPHRIQGRGCLLQPPADWQSPVRSNPHKVKLVAFDWDGTLHRGTGHTFSWESIWKYLSFDSSVQAELKRAYRQQTSADPSRSARVRAYAAWCEKACDHFRTRNLTREQLRDVAGKLALTVNCREALAKLRSEGVSIAIISGGVDTFVADGFPDYADYVDFVFMNRLLFDEHGSLTGVEASEYDFEGKAEALDLVCRRVGCTPKETVFVGDQFNDVSVMLKVPKAIAYPPGDKVVTDVMHESVTEDDLMLILPHVLTA